MSNDEKKEKEKISLENFNYESKKQRLNSPFSLKACKLQGVTEEDLYKITLEDYIQLYPESKKLPKELQQERYDNYEENRTKTIDILKETRNNLIEENEKQQEKEKEKEKEEKEKEKEENQKEEENEEEQNKYNKSGMAIKNKDNIKKYKKLKEDMELTIKVHIDREFEKVEKRRKNNAKNKKEESYEDKIKKENEARLKDRNNELNQKESERKQRFDQFVL